MNKKLKLGLSLAGFALVIAAAVIAYNTLGNRVGPVQQISAAGDSDAERIQAPDFTMLDQNGNSVRLSDMVAQGKPIVLNFWASWCPPCKVEMPDFNKVYKEVGDEVQFMMLDLTDGQRETIERGMQYIEEQGFSFPVFFDTGQEGAYTYGIRSIPATLFIDKDGYIAAGVEGAISEETLRMGIEIITTWNP